MPHPRPALPHALDAGAPRRAALGVIVLASDEVLEADLRRLVPDPGVRVHHSRIASAPEVDAASLAAMADTLTAAAGLLPASVGLDAIGYACTSAATVLGPDQVARRIAAAHPGVPATDPLSALIAACRGLQVQRIGLVSPYVAEVSDALRARLRHAGIAVTAFGSFERREEHEVARIAPDSIRDALLAIGSAPACEAVFASCTNLRAVEVLAGVEAGLGKPALASTQVLAWHLLRLARVDDRLRAFGALGACPLPGRPEAGR